MPFEVSGRIYEAESGLGISNLIIEVFDKDLFKDDELGQARTNNNGNFEITYYEGDFKEMFEGNPDLYIVVKTPDGSQILYSSEKNVRHEASANEHFEVAISTTLLAGKQESSSEDKQL